MMQTQRSEYLSFRRKFEPASVKLVIVAESPPASGKYFYNPEGAVSEPLFSALMLQLGFTPTSRESGLQEFQQRGWVLVDATYEPVNALDDQDRDGVITRDYHLLRDDLAAMLPDRSIPIILMKANVCRLLERRLTEDGFNVRNNGRVVYFPSTGRQKDFQRQFSEILKSVRSGARRPRGKKPPANEIGNPVFTALKEFGKDALIVVIKELGNAVRTAFQRYEPANAADPSQAASVEADEMADAAGVNRKTFRQALRNRGFAWHTHGERWVVEVGSPEHQNMLDVLATLT